MESPFLGLKILENPKNHILIQDVKRLDKNAYFQSLKESLDQSVDGSSDQQVVVFIHGFNVPFHEAVVRTAQITYDIEFTGAPILFSWPSEGSFLAYTSDRENATWSIAYLRQFLNAITQELHGSKIHLIAHSMGNQVLIGALQLMKLEEPDRAQMFQSVTLAAPDFDAELFADQIASNVRDVAQQWTIYTSDKDAALDISVKVNVNKRLGQPVTPIAGFDVIDATGIEVSPWSVPEFHSYYATKQKVITDLANLILGKSGAERGLARNTQNGIPYYTLH